MSANLTDQFQGQGVDTLVHYTSYAEDWNGRTKCNLPVLGGAVVATAWAAVTCPECKRT